jgi:hypothetical protein
MRGYGLVSITLGFGERPACRSLHRRWQGETSAISSQEWACSDGEGCVTPA